MARSLQLTWEAVKLWGLEAHSLLISDTEDPGSSEDALGVTKVGVTVAAQVSTV